MNNRLRLSRREIGNRIRSNDSQAHRARSAGVTTVAPFLQTKLTVGPAGDRYEQEADRVAKDVVSHVGASAATADKGAQRQPEEEELMMSRLQRQSIEDEELLQGKWLQRQGIEDEELMMKPVVGMEGGDLDSATDSAIDAARGGGSPLPDPVRRDMEGALGSDFSGVRVHTGSQSDQLNESLSARAFTTGNDIFIRNGDYQPTTSGGQELLAHELTHVVQQRGE